jgi:hypothetical protein
METPIDLVETLFERAEDYSKTTVELFKLKAINKSSDVISSLVSRFAILLVITLFVLIISVGIALYLGEVLGKSYYGFFIIGTFYALIAILLHVFRYQWIKYPVSNSIIKQLLKHP